MNTTRGDIAAADPKTRKKLLIALVVIIPAALDLSHYLIRYIEQRKVLAGTDPQPALQRFLQLIRIILFARAR